MLNPIDALVSLKGSSQRGEEGCRIIAVHGRHLIARRIRYQLREEIVIIERKLGFPDQSDVIGFPHPFFRRKQLEVREQSYGN